MARVVVVMRFVARQSVRLSVDALGFTLLGVGVVLLVTPGPGLLVISAGLAILARDFTWAATALGTVRTRAAQAKKAAMRHAPRRARPPRPDAVD